MTIALALTQRGPLRTSIADCQTPGWDSWLFLGSETTWVAPGQQLPARPTARSRGTPGTRTPRRNCPQLWDSSLHCWARLGIKASRAGS